MRARLTVLMVLLCICSACESKPVRPTREKLTAPTPKETRIEFDVKTLEAPGGDQRIESALILNPGIQDCLRQSSLQNTEILVEISGEVRTDGRFRNVQVTQSQEVLRSCILLQLKKIAVEPGPAGRFRVRFTRVLEGKPKSKTILLDKKEPKKFQ